MTKQLTIILVTLLVINACASPTEKNKQKNMATQINDEHAVIIHFTYGIQGLDSLYSLEDKLEDIIEENELGELDGHEIATDYSDGFLYMYGPDANALFVAIKPTLMLTEFMKGAKVKLRFGPPKEGVKELEVEIE